MREGAAGGGGTRGAVSSKRGPNTTGWLGISYSAGRRSPCGRSRPLRPSRPSVAAPGGPEGVRPGSSAAPLPRGPRSAARGPGEPARLARSALGGPTPSATLRTAVGGFLFPRTADADFPSEASSSPSEAPLSPVPFSLGGFLFPSKTTESLRKPPKTPPPPPKRSSSPKPFDARAPRN